MAKCEAYTIVKIIAHISSYTVSLRYKCCRYLTILSRPEFVVFNFIGAWAIPEIGLGSGHIVYTDVACEGNEETLSDCEKSDEITSEWCFSHEHDAGIICLDG